MSIEVEKCNLVMVKVFQNGKQGPHEVLSFILVVFFLKKLKSLLPLLKHTVKLLDVKRFMNFNLPVFYIFKVKPQEARIKLGKFNFRSELRQEIPNLTEII